MIKAYNAKVIKSVNFKFTHNEKEINGKTYCLLIDADFGEQKLCLINSLSKDLNDGDLISVGLCNGKYDIIRY